MLVTLKQHIGTPSRKLFIPNTSFLRIAATTIIVCGIGFGYWKLAPRTKQPAYAQLAVSTNAGEKKTITLSDGSEITLKPSSQLKYPARFSSASREISLVEGEAFFKIAHDEKRPFSVQLPEKLYTRVLGTSFTIRAFKACRKMNISVSTGKVAVGNKNQVFGTLIKGQQITYDKNKQSVLISQSPVPDTKIVFDGITLQQAMNKLEYIYSIKIDLSPAKMGNMGCTATFHSKQTPEEILGILSSLYNFKFKIAPDHKSFKIYKKMNQ